MKIKETCQDGLVSAWNLPSVREACSAWRRARRAWRARSTGRRRTRTRWTCPPTTTRSSRKMAVELRCELLDRGVPTWCAKKSFQVICYTCLSRWCNEMFFSLRELIVSIIKFAKANCQLVVGWRSNFRFLRSQKMGSSQRESPEFPEHKRSPPITRSTFLVQAPFFKDLY